MEPIILCFNPNLSNNLSSKLSKGDYTETLARLENGWKNIAPNYPFEFTFMDEALERNYREEKAMSNIFNYFAVVSILISGLGLFALLSFSIQSRIKEIGIRKVLGATLPQLSYILIKDFIILLLLAFIITTPINIYLMTKWLEEFAYAVSIGPISFLLSLLIGITLSAITVSFHIWKVSKADPIDALRYE